MPRYNDEQKAMVKRLVDSIDDESQMPILYSVLVPTTPTIEKWVKGEKEGENRFRRALQWVREDPYKIGWFIAEFVTAFFIFVVSLFCLEIWAALLGEVNPDIIAFPDGIDEYVTGFWGLVPRLGLGAAAFGAILAYVYARTERKHSGLKVIALVLLIAAFIALVLYSLFFFALILTGTHPAFLFFVGGFFATIVFAYLAFLGRWMNPASHDGYRSLMDLVTILALVITITIGAFTLLNGESFPEKIVFLQAVLGS